MDRSRGAVPSDRLTHPGSEATRLSVQAQRSRWGDPDGRPSRQRPVIPNFRDIGGHATRSGSRVRTGQLYRSVALDRAIRRRSCDARRAWAPDGLRPAHGHGAGAQARPRAGGADTSRWTCSRTRVKPTRGDLRAHGRSTARLDRAGNGGDRALLRGHLPGPHPTAECSCRLCALFRTLASEQGGPRSCTARRARTAPGGRSRVCCCSWACARTS